MTLDNKEYNNLTNYVNQNLLNSNMEEIVFESYEVIYEDILEFPVSKLLKIKSDKQFIYEVYYKLLDRIVDKKALEHYLENLEKNKITRIEFIKNIFESNERKIKCTNIIFDLDSI